jgi:hypothetical protein
VTDHAERLGSSGEQPGDPAAVTPIAFVVMALKVHVRCRSAT